MTINIMRDVLKKFRRSNQDLLKNPNNYLFIGKYLRKMFIVTNLDMNDVILPVNYLYRDGTIVIDGTSYEIISREEYRRLD